MAAYSEKPPIGIEPEFIWRERRIEELIRAISRYVSQHIYAECMVAWAKELEYHLWWMENETRWSQKIKNDKNNN